MGNPIKWWCPREKAAVYLNESGEGLPQVCIDCDKEGCSLSYEWMQKYYLWLKDCPVNNEVLFEYGYIFGQSINKVSKEDRATYRLVFSMPPAVVHHYRNKHSEEIFSSRWMKLLKFLSKRMYRKVKMKKYHKFIGELSVKCTDLVPGYNPVLPHWKNPKMDQSCYFVTEAQKHLKSRNYSI